MQRVRSCGGTTISSPKDQLVEQWASRKEGKHRKIVTKIMEQKGTFLTSLEIVNIYLFQFVSTC